MKDGQSEESRAARVSFGYRRLIKVRREARLIGGIKSIYKSIRKYFA